MANKKPSKSVLDYDPLAWLAEEDDITEEPDKEDIVPATQKVASNKTVTKKAVKKKAVIKKPAVKKTASKKATLKKPKAIEEISNQTETEKPAIKEVDVTIIEANDMNDSKEEDQGFGFFDDAPEDVPVTATEETEDEQGFGFFDSAEQLTTQSVELDEATHIIKLGAELTIRSVSACKELIDGNLSNGFDIKIAAGDLQKIDTAGLQLIYSLNKCLESTSQSITWVSSNSIINDAALLIGMPKLMESSDDEGTFGFF